MLIFKSIFYLGRDGITSLHKFVLLLKKKNGFIQVFLQVLISRHSLWSLSSKGGEGKILISQQWELHLSEIFF